MKITLIAIGKKMPAWVNDGLSDYLKRLPPYCTLNIQAFNPPHQTKGNRLDTKQKESQLLISYIPKNAYVIALTPTGKHFSTPALAKKLDALALLAKPICLIIGGAEGLSDALLNQVDECWSLSALTFPHPLARLILVEQLYRAFTINANHPYHRT